MFIKVAGFVLVGSVAALAGIGIADLAGYDVLESRRFDRHVFQRREHVKHFEYRGRHEGRRRIEVERALARAEAEVAAAEVNAEAAQVIGTYRFDARGDVLNKLEWGARVELELQPDNRYRLHVITSADGKAQEETSWGAYRVRGDRLHLISAHDNERLTFTIAGDRLQFDAGWKEKVALRAIGVDDAFMSKVHE